MIVIHIGLRKAGSTSIQGFLAANRDALAGLGVGYPRVGGAKSHSNHVNIAAEIRGRRNFDPRAGTLEEIAAWRRETDIPTVALSAEAFEECNPAEAARLKTALARDGEEVRIVLVLRDLVDLTPSSYAQMVKTGRKTHDFDLFFIRRLGERRMNYAETAARWAEAYGWDALRVRLLERAHLLNGDLIDDFLAILGLDPAGVAAALARPAMANVTPGWKVVEAIRALYADRAGLTAAHPLRGVEGLDAEGRRKLGLLALDAGEAMGWNADRGLYLTSIQAQECLDHYREAVAALNARMGGALPTPLDLRARGFEPREFLPDSDLIEPAELGVFYDRLGELARARLGTELGVAA